MKIGKKRKKAVKNHNTNINNKDNDNDEGKNWNDKGETNTMNNANRTWSDAVWLYHDGKVSGENEIIKNAYYL